MTSIPPVDTDDLGGQLQRLAAWCPAIPEQSRVMVAIQVDRLTRLIGAVVADTTEPEA